MKRFLCVAVATLMLCATSVPASFSASSRGSECKTEFDQVRPQIKAMSDPAKKQQAAALAKGAFSDMKSGEYQNCLDKLKQIKVLLQ